MPSARRSWIWVVAGAVLGGVAHATPAIAHTGGPIHGLSDGLLHPLFGVDHLLAMIAVGILAVTLSRPLLVPAAFVSAMVLGGASGMAGVHVPFAELSIALSVVALGGALVAGRLVHIEIAVALVALAGLVHGHAHGVEAPAAAHPAIYVLGFVLATAALHAAGVAMGRGVRTRVAARAAMGAAVAGVGVGLVAGLI